MNLPDFANRLLAGSVKSMSNEYGPRTEWHNPPKPAKVKVFVIVNAGSVTAVYADSNAVEVEIIDQDSQEEGERDRALKREDEIAVEYVRCD
jgi:hypothetical protein